jgi:hypothetical protein
MSYRVRISESLLRPLPQAMRARIKLELAQVAATAEGRSPLQRLTGKGDSAEALPMRALPGGYWVSYDVNDLERTVKLIVVGQPKGAVNEGGGEPPSPATPP